MGDWSFLKILEELLLAKKPVVELSHDFDQLPLPGTDGWESFRDCSITLTDFGCDVLDGVADFWPERRRGFDWGGTKIGLQQPWRWADGRLLRNT